MLAVSIATLAGGALFATFHLPVRVLTTGRLPRLLGIGYHLLLLPAVATLPAPEWVKAAGFAWMLIDVVLNGAVFVGIDDAVAGAMRQGVHVLSALWVLVAGWSNGWVLGTFGTLLAAAFTARFLLAGMTKGGGGAWLRWVNAVLNVAWIIAVAVRLWPR